MNEPREVLALDECFPLENFPFHYECPGGPGCPIPARAWQQISYVYEQRGLYQRVGSARTRFEAYRAAWEVLCNYPAYVEEYAGGNANARMVLVDCLKAAIRLTWKKKNEFALSGSWCCCRSAPQSAVASR